jgi:TonB family protein
MVVAVLVLAFLGSTVAGTPGLKVYFASDFKDMAYQKKAFDKVAKSWKRPAETPEPGSKAVVIVTIMLDGTVAETKLHYKSGSEAWDRAAVETFKRVSSFDPLPKGYPRPSVEAHFHFEWGN